jgi:phosphopantothenoylcysteine decarboxylase/phosphopantothenate--cysteine ligase
MKMKSSDPLKDIQSTHGKELNGRRIILSVTGSVASVETPSLARELMRHGAEVKAVMSEAAWRLLRPDLLEWATGNPVIKSLTGKTEHVRLFEEQSGKSDLLLIAPCTANTISKIALGIDDTSVTTFASMALGSGMPIVICPAAHEPMYRNLAVVQNLARLKEMGIEVIQPRIEEGKAKMADNQTIVAAVMRVLAEKDLEGRNVLVTGGPTVEFIDPIRVITNLSSGKMGLSLAKEAWRRGAEISYVYGGNLSPPTFINSKRVLTTEDMLKAIISELQNKRVNLFISAAAPADFTPENRSEEKIATKRGSFALQLKPTKKIIGEVKKRWPELFIVAFKAETANSIKELEPNARKYLKESEVDMVIANTGSRGEAFGSDYNEVLIITINRSVHLTKDLKEDLAKKIMDAIISVYNKSGKR